MIPVPSSQKIEVVIETPSRHEEESGTVCKLWVLPLAENRLRLLESSCFLFSDYLLLWGDELVTERQSDNSYRVIEVVNPSSMLHMFYVGGSPLGDLTFAEILHSLGGEWECDMGALTMVHVPRAHLDGFLRSTGIPTGQWTVSGFVDLNASFGSHG